jgi:hypothetical protein
MGYKKGEMPINFVNFSKLQLQLYKSSLLTKNAMLNKKFLCFDHKNKSIHSIDQKSIIHRTSFSCPHFDFLDANDMFEKRPVFFS